MIGKATPRPATEARQESAPHHNRLISRLVSRPETAADYVLLATLLHHPDLAAPYVSRLRPADWTTELHQIIARMGLWHLRTIGRVDHRQLVDVLHDAGTIRSDSFALELATLARVAELICTDAIVADAVAVVTAHRRGAA